ncbi:MAG: 2,3-bisphosphoglycerate-dependent phosphoglycerate mutase [Cryomorphaceae bacterium]
MGYLVLIRHGESIWNRENKYTGWTDIGLSEKGIEESARAGELLGAYSFDKGYTSRLERARCTMQVILKSLNADDTPVLETKSLNERNFGDLEGLKKSAALEKYGEKNMAKWLKGFEYAPPHGESLKQTSARVLEFFKTVIAKDLNRGENVLLVAHGMVMRILIGALENMDWENSVQIEVPNAHPRIYLFDKINGVFVAVRQA